MASAPIRVPEETHAEVQAAARLLDCSSGELLRRAWQAYRGTPEFQDDFRFAQKAFASGDLGVIAERLRERGEQRAAQRAAGIRESRSEG